MPAPGSIPTGVLTTVLTNVLTTARAVHRLPLTAAARAYPIRLRAVVTYFDPSNWLLFVQDSSDGVSLSNSDDKESVSMRAGDEVEITGVSSAGFAPNVGQARIKVLGHSHLPVPKSGSFENASRGREDCRWLELGGIVQHVAQGVGDSLLTLALGKNTYEAHVLASPKTSLAHLVDAEVKLQGACGAMFNSRNQLLGFRLFVPGTECIRVLRAPSADPFSLAPTAIADLLQFSRVRDVSHRVRLRGTVTYPNRSGSTWVQDSTGGAMLQDHDASRLATGDLVDVVGFPAIDGFGPALHSAQVKRVQSGTPPLPARITAQEALKGDFDGQLVQIEGKLVDRLREPAEQVLVVESGETVFEANLPGAGAARPLEAGTRVRLTGICSVEVERSHDSIRPRTFRVLLRSPADVAIVERPPWLTVGRVVPFLAGALLLMFAALAWVGAAAQSECRLQTLELRARTIQLQAAHQKNP